MTARQAAQELHLEERTDRLQFRLIFLASFAICLIGAALCRLTGGRFQPWPPGPDGYRSVVAEATMAANTIAVTVLTCG